MIVCLLDNGAGKVKAGVCRNSSVSSDLLLVKHYTQELHAGINIMPYLDGKCQKSAVSDEII